jgi:transcription initiation factor TFIID TATA-box-binding protein
MELENIVIKMDFQTKERIDLNSLVSMGKYEPSKFPALIIKLGSPKCSLLLFRTNKIISTGLKVMDQIPSMQSQIILKLAEAGIEIIDLKSEIVNLVATGNLDLKEKSLDLNELAINLNNCMYEPSIFPGLIYRMQNPHATFLIFGNGKFVCTGLRKEIDISQATSQFQNEVKQLNCFRVYEPIADEEEMYFV